MQILIIFAVVGGAWLFQLDVKLLPAMRPAVQSQIAEARRNIGGFFGSGAQEPYGGVEERQTEQDSYEPVQAKYVARDGRQCSITQGIRNLDEKPISRVTLKVAFEDALGHPIGSETEAMIAAALEAGAQDNFTFRVPCPRSFANVEVRLPSESRKIALVSSDLVGNAAESSAWKLAIKAPEPSICPLPDSCELLVRSPGGGTARYSFHRDAKAPKMLITEDSILIGHLRRHGIAWLQVPSHSGETEILLTDQHLRAARQPGILARWIGKLI